MGDKDDIRVDIVDGARKAHIALLAVSLALLLAFSAQGDASLRGALADAKWTTALVDTLETEIRGLALWSTAVPSDSAEEHPPRDYWAKPVSIHPFSEADDEILVDRLPRADLVLGVPELRDRTLEAVAAYWGAWAEVQSVYRLEEITGMARVSGNLPSKSDSLGNTDPLLGCEAEKMEGMWWLSRPIPRMWDDLRFRPTGLLVTYGEWLTVPLGAPETASLADCVSMFGENTTHILMGLGTNRVVGLRYRLLDEGRGLFLLRNLYSSIDPAAGMWLMFGDPLRVLNPSFAKTFPMLAAASTGLESLPVQEVFAVLSQRYEQDRQSISVLGVQLPRDTLGTIGLIALVGAQLHLLMFVRLLAQQSGTWPALVRWVATHPGRLAAGIFYTTAVALPLAAVWKASGIDPTIKESVSLQLIIVCIAVATAAQTVRYYIVSRGRKVVVPATQSAEPSLAQTRASRDVND